MTAGGSAKYGDFDRPEVLALVPATARRVLDIGCNTGTLGAALKQRQACEVVGIEVDAEAAEKAREVLNEAFDADVETLADRGVQLGYPGGWPAYEFDAIILADVLEHLHDPAKVLRWARGLLAEGGVLVLSVPNARHISVVAALAEGGFTREVAGLLDKTHLQHFTRRELQVLLDACGYGIGAEVGVRGPGYEEWDAAGRKGEAHQGRFTAGPLSSEEAEEFFIYQWLVVAHPKPQEDYGLTSIIIPVFNGLADTAACLASIFKHTPEPVELIVVDNGSTDGTGAWLEGSCPVPVKVLRNEINRGYPTACNQGAAAATGNQVLFLNNDTLVTPGWLRRLLEALHSAEDVAAVGPRSNFVAPPQMLERMYPSLLELDAWAWGWSLKRWHERIPAHRLVGFCLLAKREWWERVGAFDEGYGLGNFEDDDLCRRLEAAGGRLLVANDSFVHHEGGQTFRREGIDYAALMAENQARFLAKWAGGGAAPSFAAAAPSAPPSPICRASGAQNLEDVPVARPKITVVHPTARVGASEAFPQGWLAACRQWFETADHPEEIEYVLSVHESRWAEMRALTSQIPAWLRLVPVCSHGRDNCVDNAAAAVAASTGQLLVVSMDDLFAPPHWDTLLLEAAGDLDREAVLHCLSGAPNDGTVYIPQIWTRARYERLGYMGHPDYEGMFVDNEMAEHARRDGVVVEATHIVFDHHHPLLNGGPDDEVYRRQNAPEAYEKGLAILRRRAALGFPRE